MELKRLILASNNLFLGQHVLSEETDGSFSFICPSVKNAGKITTFKSNLNDENPEDFFYFPLENGTFVPAYFTQDPVQCPNRTVSLKDDIKFILYQRWSSEGQVIDPDTEIDSSIFSKDAPTVFVTHGYWSSPRSEFGETIRRGISRFASENQNFNLVFVDWEGLASSWCYLRVLNIVQIVGNHTATMISSLIRQNITSMENIIYIGHSLGTHVANYVSANLPIGSKLTRIIALDPASPCFVDRNDSHRIDPTDADFVQVIQTESTYLGFFEPRGHMDFYPNRGKMQPACMFYLGFYHDIGCSHSMSYRYLAESISRPSSFFAHKCENLEQVNTKRCSCSATTNMGWNLNETAQPPGLYLLETNDRSPYSKHLDEPTSLDESQRLSFITKEEQASRKMMSLKYCISSSSTIQSGIYILIFVLAFLNM